MSIVLPYSFLEGGQSRGQWMFPAALHATGLLHMSAVISPTDNHPTSKLKLLVCMHYKSDGDID